MYPNLYYVFKDWFGVEWKALSFLNTFGLFVAIAFVVAAIVLSSELKRKEKQGLLVPREEMITVGEPASAIDLIINGLVGFLFGYKLIGLFFSKPENITAQEYIFSREGSIIGGVLIAILLAAVKWQDKNKQKLKEPERRMVRIWPHDRVGDIIILGLVFGILGAKLFDNFENWDDFIAHPIERLFSASGLTFYGGLILATIAICWFAVKKGIKLRYLVDAAAPALMIAYAIGRIGCQVSGDGDWGVYNSAYISDASGTVPNKNFKGVTFLPTWFFAYTYPQNVNKDGILMPGVTDEHNRVLPQPVFPTPLYETIICTLIFLFLWMIRKSVTTPMVIFGIYLMLNGIERFMVELIRINKTYDFLGFKPSQAEIIASMLALSGLILIIVAKMLKKVE